MSLIRLLLLRILFRLAFKLLDAEERALGIAPHQAQARRRTTAPTRQEMFPNLPEAIANKSHFVIAKRGAGWAVTVRRRGQPPVTSTCLTQGEVNRMRLDLSSQGLVGFIGDTA
ncbi:hypothetical protein [Kaistia defluvii]|uniref:Secreted protein n=1 Tax=Kaistia defluvii TaxID=410841 RepID=A0ABV2R166_9HYPH